MQQPLAVDSEDPAFRAELWKPSLREPWPRGASHDMKLHFLFRTLLHGQELAKRALQRLVSLLHLPGRNFWYVVEDINRTSVKVAEDCDFCLAGLGTRVERLKGLVYRRRKRPATTPPQRVARQALSGRQPGVFNRPLGLPSPWALLPAPGSD